MLQAASCLTPLAYMVSCLQKLVAHESMFLMPIPVFPIICKILLKRHPGWHGQTVSDIPGSDNQRSEHHKESQAQDIVPLLALFNILSLISFSAG